MRASPACPGPARKDHPCPPRPDPGAHVEVTDAGHTVATVVAGDDGTFEVDVPAGNYQVTASAPGGYRSTVTRTVWVPSDTPVVLVLDSGVR